MFGTIRKHQTWLWVFIIAVTILGMIVWTNNTGSNNQRAAGNFGSIDNKPITVREMQQAENDATLMYFVQTHQWPDNARDFDLQRQSYQQLFLQRKLNEYNIHADPDAAAHLATIIISQPWEQGQAISMDEFLKYLKAKGLTAEDFEHFLENYIAFQQLESVIGFSGKVVTPEEIQSLYKEQYQELAADAVFFSASNYLARIPAPTPEALGQFYTNQMAVYHEPDKMQLSYVYYNVTNFMPQAEQQMGTNLDRLVNDNMVRVGTNFLRLGKTVEEARAKVREAIIQEVAASNAIVSAKSLEADLADKKTNVLENLAAVAKQKGLEVKVTKPFDKQFGPSEFNLGSGYPVGNFFDLSPEEPLLSTPIRGLDGVYIIALNQFVPNRVPPLSEIRSRVEADYKFQQALRLAQVNGQSFAATLTNELAHGKTFAQTCEATRVTPVLLPPFSLATTRLPEVEDHVDLNEFKSTAFGTPLGSASHFTETPDGGFVIHVRQSLPVDEAKMKAQLPEFANLVRQRRQGDAFNIWFSVEWGKSMRDIPALRKQQ